MAKLGYKVGLVDADIYGPSMPKMFGCEDASPYMVEVGGKELIEPVVKYGVKLLSIGFFVDPGFCNRVERTDGFQCFKTDGRRRFLG